MAASGANDGAQLMKYSFSGNTIKAERLTTRHVFITSDRRLDLESRLAVKTN